MKIQGLALVNSEIIDINSANISVLDRGFLFGHAVFETFMVLDGKLLAWEEHYARLTSGCKQAILQLPDEYLLKDLTNKLAIEAYAKFNKPLKMQLRLILTGGDNINFKINYNNNQLPPSKILQLCRVIQGTTNDLFTKGIALKTIYDERSPKLLSIKSNNYLWNVIAFETAISEGFDDALFVNKSNYCTETSTASFIWLDSNFRINCIADFNNTLPGTTLATLNKVLVKNNLELYRKGLSVDSLEQAQSCAIISSTRGIIPVNQINDFNFPLHKCNNIWEKFNRLLEIEQRK